MGGLKLLRGGLQSFKKPRVIFQDPTHRASAFDGHSSVQAKFFGIAAQLLNWQGGDLLQTAASSVIFDARAFIQRKLGAVLIFNINLWLY